MVIVATPHTEPVPSPMATQSLQGVPETEQQTQKAEKSSLGVFAKILAGLTDRGLHRKTGTGEQAVKAEIPDVPLAETAELGVIAEEAVNVNVKNTNTKKAAPAAVIIQNDAGRPVKTGAYTEDARQPELSEQEKNILLLMGGLVDRNEVAALTEENADLHGEVNSDGEKTDFAQLPQEKSAEIPLKQEVAVESVAFQKTEKSVQNPVINGEKVKSSRFSAETQAVETQTTSQIENEKVAVQAGAKNAGDETATGERRGRLEEVRNREKRRGATFELRDFRTQAETAGKENSFRIATGGENRPLPQAEREITLELRLPQGREASSAAATSSWETGSGQAIENLLARELHQNFNNDIVRHASILLRDGNEGIIKLALKPESLGNVKIRLEMAENKIMGHIVVESEEALRAFEKEISSLEKAFQDSGFEGASLEMSLAADGGAGKQWQGTEASRALAGQFAASRYDTAVEWDVSPAVFDVYHRETRAVNILA